MSQIKAGVGISKEKDAQAAVQEAYRMSLQKLGALKADLSIVVYTYDHVLEPDVFSSVLKRTLKNVPHIGCSTWSAWNEAEMIEGEGGLMVLSLIYPGIADNILKVHSLKEKQDLWASEILRFLDGIEGLDDQEHSLMVISDGINFQSHQGFQKIRRSYPKLKTFGFGTSYGIPQCSLVHDGEVYTNALIAMLIPNMQPWDAVIQNIRPEASEIQINRMSENLLIEIDEKPAFYRLCEHLMNEDDLPMMSPDEFRKHMGNMYIVEKEKDMPPAIKSFGETYRIVSLLGSEMTTGMVAVGESLDFGRRHFLGQKKVEYAEERAETLLDELKEKVPNPKMIWCFCATAHFRDRERTRSDIQLVSEKFPGVPIFGVGSHGEYLDGQNHQSAVVLAIE